DRMRRHLTADNDERDGIHVRRRDPGDRIGHARAGSDHDYPNLVRRARIAVCAMHRRLLMAHEDVLELVLLEDLVVDRQDRTTRIAEYELHALRLQTTDGDLRSGQIDLRRHSRGGHFHFLALLARLKSLRTKNPRLGETERGIWKRYLRRSRRSGNCVDKEKVGV